MQIANVKHSHCEAKFGFRVWETKFGRVRRKTAPTGPGHSARKLFLKLTPMVWFQTAPTGLGTEAGIERGEDTDEATDEVGVTCPLGCCNGDFHRFSLAN